MLRIPLFEVSEKEGVGEVLEMRGVVSHDVSLARDVERGVVIAVLTLVLARPVAEVGRRAVGGHRALADAGHRRGVVGAVHESGVAHVVGGGHEVHLAEETGVFEVAVGEIAANNKFKEAK